MEEEWKHYLHISVRMETSCGWHEATATRWDHTDTNWSIMTSCDRFPHQTRINLLNSICFLPVYIYKLQRRTVTIVYCTWHLRYLYFSWLLPFPAVIYSNFYTFYSPYLLDYFNYKLLCRLHDSTQLKLQVFRLFFSISWKKPKNTDSDDQKNKEYWILEWWNVIKYIYLSTALQVLLLYDIMDVIIVL